MENQQVKQNANNEFQLLKSMRGVRNAVTIVKDATNPHFKSGYAKLDQIIAKLDTAVEQHGLEYNQHCEKETIFTKVLHHDGFSVVTESPVLNKKGDSQGYGSGQTYAMRYGLCMAFGIAPTDDDDGNGAAIRPVNTGSNPAAFNNNAGRIVVNNNQELNPSDYVIQVGFKKGKKLGELTENEMMQQHEFWSTKNSQSAQEFIAAIDNYKNDKMKR